MKYNPAIVVIAFNRIRSLERLLLSLKSAKKIQNAKLIISIDNKEPENLNVRNLAETFEWPYGEKEVIYQQKRLGLKKHVLQCGDLSQKYGSVILLEDDLMVSPYFYDYAVKALEFYGGDDKIGGVSLYNYPYEDLLDLPYTPIQDDSDVYFIKFPSSLGQTWTAKHWTDFREWLDMGTDLKTIPISEQVYNWPETSWKKLYSAYLVARDKYFVFPRLSLTTNFNDPGTHKALNINYNGQIPLRFQESEYRFKPFADSFCIYDAHFELEASMVKKFCSDLADIDFEMDLYGHKELSRIMSTHVITSRPVKNSIKSYMRALKPHEMNILLGLSGEDLKLCRKEDILPTKNSNEWLLSEYKYYIDSYLMKFKLLIYNRLKQHKYLSKLFN